MSEEMTNQNLSLQKVLLPGHDPGWNDPPKWAYSVAQSSITPTKRMLNKRVAFPMTSIQAKDKESSLNKPLNMPPPIQSAINLTTASHPPLLCPSNKNNLKGKMNEININKEETLNNVLTNLEAVINEHISEKNSAEEVKKKLDILKTAWLEDKLNNVIYKNILDLSTALREGNIEKADEIHIALMMYHANLCNTWIPGIRHIILGLKTKMKNSNITYSQSSESNLLLTERNE
ncbi:steroid receptor RNA activator 1 isoform X1 [Apis mellifera caucasica]|uniref:Steroid receptor RNA activator 1 isoform X1 n=2 Tax=Apis mellifera TaxID=7460 RepID=A0A7M7GA67_APIME|nr:steroid receptor RNA activator 1 isoform X1 [Apis mellifera]KAG6798100.1 steroid receptor RNA activator 1 isoform X1 [Apis mellifera caucasica]KAG9429854.1 steroid receptor RNA activator 1 isoform X1 [Apis mellifera carnica]|eukprot:XP_003249830.1 steroid receptor RNA activator 1 isoform X1 [Apis mellifera]